MVKVLFLGPRGTYSHQAAIQQFPNEELIPVRSIHNCFEELNSDKSIDFGVVPLENSTNGQVVFTYDLFRDFMQEDAEPKLEVVGEQYVKIEHCLIAPCQLKEEDLKRVDTIYSHPQVWGQVNGYLEELNRRFGSFVRVDCNSTSDAVKRCRREYKENGKITLSIASRAGCAVHEGHLVDTGINDIKGNTTRFLVLKRRDNPISIDSIPTQGTKSKNFVSFVTFVINQDSPGSLVEVLNVLKVQNLNMCSINSRPFHNNLSRERNWQYCFFAEYYDNEDGDRKELARGFDENCAKWIHWGKFPRDGSYYEININKR